MRMTMSWRLGPTISVAVLCILCTAVASSSDNLLRKESVFETYVPTCGRQVVYMDTKSNGFGAQILRVAEMVALGYYYDSPLHLVPQRWWNYGCGPFKTWDCYFESPTPVCREASKSDLSDVPEMQLKPADCAEYSSEMLDRKSSNHPACVTIQTEAAEHQLHADLEEYFKAAKMDSLHAWRALIRRLWLPKEHIREQIDATMDAMDLNELPYISVHIRRGDKKTEVSYQATEKYAKAVRALGAGIRTVFVASDDFNAVKEIEQALPGYLVLSLSVGNEGHLQGSMNKMTFNQTMESTIKLIAEAEILSKGEYFVGTFSSNLGRLVHLLRKQPKDTTLSMDVLWTSGNAWRGFNSEYCEAPDANGLWCSILDSSFM